MDWNEIDTYIYAGNLVIAGLLLRDRYDAIHDHPLLIDASRIVVYDRETFLKRHPPDCFAPQTSYFIDPSKRWVHFTSKFEIIRLHAEWNLYPTGPHIAEINFEEGQTRLDELICFAECVMKADDPLHHLLIENDLETVYQQMATVFDPDFPRETHEQMLARAEAILQEQSKELGVPYFLPSEYNPNWRTIENWDYWD